MTTYTLETKKKFEITARSVAIAFGLTFLLLFFLNMLNYQDPKPSESGIFVILNNNDSSHKKESSAVLENENEVIEKVDVPKKKENKTDKTKVKKKVIKDDLSENISIENKENKEKKEVIEDVATNDEAKQNEADDLKNGIKDALSNGKTNSEASDNEANDPDTNKLDDLSTGSGMIGGGLDNRAGSGPKITDKSQVTGMVVVKVCVDDQGDVVSAKFTQIGSTTTDSQLKNIAKENAKKWKFKKGGIDKQCGTITYDFKVK